MNASHGVGQVARWRRAALVGLGLLVVALAGCASGVTSSGTGATSGGAVGSVPPAATTQLPAGSSPIGAPGQMGASSQAGRENTVVSSSPTTVTAPLLVSAREQLTSVSQTDYQHQTDVDAAAGRYDYDCSGLLDYTVGLIAPDALAQVPVSTTAGRALAEDFEQYFAGLTAPNQYWAPVDAVAQLAGGDVIAWLISPDTASRDTGHVMIVAAPPVPDPSNAGAYLGTVIDSTTMPHADDSRSAGQTGLGTGTIGLQTDSAGKPVGFYWNGGVPPDLPTQIAMARLAG